MPNKLHRYYGAGYLHFITTSCYRRLPLLGGARDRDLLLQVLERVRRRYHIVALWCGRGRGAVPFGDSGSVFGSLPRTCVRGYYLSSLAGLARRLCRR
jgi:hypothetical protein